jgi:hypothetical protein
MSLRRIALLAASTLVMAALTSSAAAQTPAPVNDGARGVRLGGDLAAVFGPRDVDAFFNYTDYEHNALRLARIRLSGEWRLSPALSLLAQAQTENGDHPEAVAAYARWRPWTTRGFVVQIGRIPPVVGAFARRAYSADNALIGTPLAYQYLLSLRPDALPSTIDDVLRMRGRGWQSSFPIGSPVPAAGIPLLSSRWDTGVEAGWRGHVLDLSGAVTMGAPSVPRFNATNTSRQWSGRAAVHLAPGLVLGFSGSHGHWIDRRVLVSLPEDRQDSTQELVGADVECGRGPWLMRAEWLHSSFAVPFASGAVPVGHLSSSALFADVRYRIHPRWQVALRTEQLSFARVVGTFDAGRPTTWDAPVQRIETVVGFRVTRNIDVRGGWQYDWRDGGRVHERGFPAFQVLTWF